jgi:hypothetical protein
MCPLSPPPQFIIKRKTTAPGAPIKKKKKRGGLRLFVLPEDDDVSDLEIRAPHRGSVLLCTKVEYNIS